MKDKLAEFIADYNDGIITLGDLQRRLSFDQWKKDSKPLPSDYLKEPMSPEEIYFSKVNQQEQMKYFLWLRRKTTKMNWKIIYLIARGYRQHKIAEKLGVAQSTISKHLDIIAERFPEMKAILHLGDECSTVQAKVQKPNSVYPMDEAMKAVNEEGKRKCRVPEYLIEQNCKSLCLYCEKCNRKKVNKE